MVVKLVEPALSYTNCNPVVIKSFPCPMGCLYSMLNEPVLYGTVTLPHWFLYTPCMRMSPSKIPASDGLRNKGVSKNWEKCISCADTLGPGRMAINNAHAIKRDILHIIGRLDSFNNANKIVLLNEINIS